MNAKKTVAVVKDTVSMCIEKQISRSAAELSYFLTLSVFPTLICLYAMLGNFYPEAESLLVHAKGFVPAESIDAIQDYLNYVSRHNNSAMLMAGLLLMASSSAAAFRSLHNIMGEIQGKTRYTGFFTVVFSFLFSLIFLAVVYFAVIVMVTGRWFLNFVGKYVTFVRINEAWSWLRFIILFALLLIIVYGLYRITAPKETERSLMPGAVLASFALVAISIFFSWMIGMSARYPLVYGSLASIIILMFWLYVCGQVLIIGNVFNVVLRKHKNDR